MEGLFYLFAFGVILSGIMVISALNPVHSVFWLIVAFSSAAMLFILLEVEFIAFIFLIVYVGAIAILFLFVIMMLNLMDLGNNPQDMSIYVPTGFIIGVVVILEVLIFRTKNLFVWPVNWRWDLTGITSNIGELGRVLYTDYFYLFVLASFILLAAMKGAIVLAQDKSAGVKRQDSFVQVSRKSAEG